MLGCSSRVPSNEVPGTYVASYPFGTATLTLHEDGIFTQQVSIQGQRPATARGSWTFDQKESSLTLYGSMQVVDGHGRLKSDWQSVLPEPVVASVERLWFKINIGSGGEYPYIKK